MTYYTVCKILALMANNNFRRTGHGNHAFVAFNKLKRTIIPIPQCLYATVNHLHSYLFAYYHLLWPIHCSNDTVFLLLPRG